MKKYQVIKTKERFFENIGESDSLHGAKVIAGKHKDEKPEIYLSKDCYTSIAGDDHPVFWPGTEMVIPYKHAEPIR
jgi:hypothetical protein